MKLILHMLNMSYTKSYSVKKNEPIGLIVITNGDDESFDLKHNIKDCKEYRFCH